MKTTPFTGKERDEETGYGYFGARYLDHELLTSWLSVDPMADKYPSISPYAYCAWNPVKLVDPEGMEAFENDDGWKYNTTSRKLTWLNDDGGKKRQTIKITTSTNGREVVTGTVSYEGLIQDMFDFSVFSPKTDNVINGGLRAYSGAMNFVSGLFVAAGSGGLLTAVGAGLCVFGGAEFGFGIQDITYAGGGINSNKYDKYDKHDMIVSIIKTMSIDVASTAGSILSTKKTITEGMNLAGKMILSYSSLVFDFGWSAAKLYSMNHPTMKEYSNSEIVRQKD